MTTTVEFAVQMSCDSCVSKIEKSLTGVEGIKSVKVSQDEGTVLIESSLPTSVIQEKLESSGRKAVLKGAGVQGDKDSEVFVKLEKNQNGMCPPCDPECPEKNKEEENNSLKKETEDLKDNFCDSRSQSGKMSENDGYGEELELKYSSDSDGDSERVSLKQNHSLDPDEIWKIEEDLEADFDVIDADMDDDQDKTDDAKDSTKSEEPKTKRRRNESNDHSDEEEDKVDVDKQILSLNTAIGRIYDTMKKTPLRKGQLDFVGNTNIHLHALIMSDQDDESISFDEAQTIKDKIFMELLSSCKKVQLNESNSFFLKITDCKYVEKLKCICISCHDKETYDWIMSWKIPLINEKQYKIISALDKGPLHSIKFSIKSRWIKDLDVMLKLIHLQNRDLDTSRWILDGRKSLGTNMDLFTYKVDLGSINAIRKLDWSFYYELFPVKIKEHNGKLVSSLKSAPSGRG